MNTKPLVSALFLATIATACGDPDQFLPPYQTGGPQGVLDGSVTYAGPLPCTEKGHILGAAVLLVFDVRLLPPPEGLGTTAASLGAVPGEILFAGVRDRLTFKPDGSRWCPAAGTPNVTVAAPWAISPLPGGVYEIRGFYDLDGNFDPVFSISNLPTKGDVGGGAIDNAADVLVGKAPIYRQIALGAPSANGSRVIPADGARVGEIAVTLALPLPLERPIFYSKEVVDGTGMNKDPNNITMPADFQLDTFTMDPIATEKSFIELNLYAGVDPSEVDKAVASPFGLPVKNPPPTLFYSRQDVNGDGVIDSNDHVPESTLVASLFPVAVFAKQPDGVALGNQAQPAVVLQGLTIYKNLLTTATAPTDLAEAADHVIVALRPSVLCIDPLDSNKPAVLVVTRKTDSKGNPIIADEASVKKGVSAQFHREVDIAYACLPQGKYSMNLIYGTGQAWSLPNEAGVCAPAEQPQTPTTCGKRAKLASQAVTLTIGPPKEAAYCTMAPTPAACLPPKQ